MQPYLRSRQTEDKRARLTGLAATVLIHVVALVFCLTAGLKYLDPPPPETSFLIDFEEEVLEDEKPVDTKVGRRSDGSRRRRRRIPRSPSNWCRRRSRPT